MGARCVGLAALVATVSGCAVEDGAWLFVIDPASGAARLHVRYERATTEQARRDGLGVRPPLAEDEGLLLEFPVEGEVCIHNRPVPYPIDVIFAAADDAVVRDAVSLGAGQATPVCVAGVQRVLEVRQGVGSAVVAGDHLSRD
ncbi:MAG: DUF192 domain-containing protein [Myxococcota bacterium]